MDLSTTVITAATVVQAITAIAAVTFTFTIARDQSRQMMALRREDGEQAAAARSARARVLAIRLAPILDDMQMSLGIAREHGTTAQIERILAEGGQAFARRVLDIDGEWSDEIYRDFDVLPAELAGTLAQLFYNVMKYNGILEAQIKAAQDLQVFATYLRGRHDLIERDLVRATALLAPMLAAPSSALGAPEK